MNVDKLSLSYYIRSYEGDQNSFLRLVTLMNILQDAATQDADRRGFGMEFCLQNNMTWVGNDYVIEINRLPKIGKNITLQTWPSMSGKLTARRDFAIFDADNNLIIKAASRWLLISLDKKRPLPVADTLKNYIFSQEHTIDTDFAKISELEDKSETYKYKVRYDDIDINHHINNAVYLLWAGEAINNDWRNNHSPERIEINFKKEGYIGENIEVYTDVKDNTSVHSINVVGENSRELARALIKWK
jgi:medium-chain acyl-[acyl-carrier-protein] hydrolase